MGEIRKTEKELIEKFKITKFPSMLVVTDPFSYEGEQFVEEQYQIDRIKKFLNKFAYSAPTFEKKLDVVALNDKLIRSGVCSKKSSNLCFILFTKGQNDPVLE